MLYEDIRNTKKEIKDISEYKKPVREYKRITRFSLLFLGEGFLTLGILSSSPVTAIPGTLVGVAFFLALFFV